MTKQQREETSNGAAHDTHASSSTYTSVARKQEVQGYLLIGAGALLFIYTMGWLPILNWVLMLGSIALAVYGAQKANLVEKTQHLVQRLRKK